MRRSSSARRDAAVDARHDAEGAVLLDIRVDAVVDEPRVALVFVLVAPEGLEQRSEPHFARRVLRPPASAAKTAQTDCQIARRESPRRAPALSSGTPGHVEVLAGSSVDGSPATASSSLLHLRLAGSAAGAGPRGVAELRLACDNRPRSPRMICALVTPLQLQICASSGTSPRTPRPAVRAGNSSSARSAGSRKPGRRPAAAQASRRDRRAGSRRRAVPSRTISFL